MMSTSIIGCDFFARKCFFLIICFFVAFASATDADSLFFSDDSTKSFLMERYAKNNYRGQCAVNYGEFLMVLEDSMASVSVYNLKRRKKVARTEMEPRTERRNGSIVFHANQCQFGGKMVDSDEFPLLYVAHREQEDGRGIMEVYRLKTERKKKKITSVMMDLVQVVKFPVMTDSNALGSVWPIFDDENEYMYTYSRNKNKAALNYGVCRISKFRIPSLPSDTAAVDSIFLENTDVLESFDVSFSGLLSQGGCYYKKKLYITQGGSFFKKTYLRVVDLEKKDVVESYDLLNQGFEAEPEGFFIYDGHFMMSVHGKSIYKLSIELD